MPRLRITNAQFWLPFLSGLIAGLVCGGLAAFFTQAAGWTLWLSLALSSCAAAGAAGAAAVYHWQVGLSEIRHYIKMIASGDSSEMPAKNEISLYLGDELEVFTATLEKCRQEKSELLHTLRVEILELQSLAAAETQDVKHLEKKLGEVTSQVSAAAEHLHKIISINRTLIGSDETILGSVQQMSAEVQRTCQVANDGIKTVGT
jgi:hypothetical protein